jgi:hypothetical protein
LTDNVTVQAGSNITITPSGNPLTIAGTAPPGVVKAMLLVNADGTINVCYNSQLGGSDATTPPCGFSVIRTPQDPQGDYIVSFPFQVNTRFFSATIGDINSSGGPAVAPLNATQVRVVTNGGSRDNRFYLIVF